MSCSRQCVAVCCSVLQCDMYVHIDVVRDACRGLSHHTRISPLESQDQLCLERCVKTEIDVDMSIYTSTYVYIYLCVYNKYTFEPMIFTCSSCATRHAGHMNDA